MKRKLYTFINLSVTVEASSPEAAYDLLCNEVLRGRVVDFETDQYYAYNLKGEEGQARPTSDLYPKPGSARMLKRG